MKAVANETLVGLLELVALTESSPALNALAVTENRYLRDLKVNLGNAFGYSTLSKKESYLLALAVAINDKSPALVDAFTRLASDAGASQEEIAETFACVSLLNANNVFYRFRHFTKKEFYQNTPAGIKMSIMMNPVLGKEFFELMSLMVSALNGCEMCVNAHEASVMKLGSGEQRIYDTIRLSAIVRSFTSLYF